MVVMTMVVVMRGCSKGRSSKHQDEKRSSK